MTRPYGQDKYRSRENKLRVREIFLTVWDPIGVGQEAPDEYDTYANRAYVMMMYEDASVGDVARYLHATATEYIGLPETPFSMSQATAEALFALKQEFQRPLQ